ESTLLEANLKLAPGLPSIPKPTLRRPRSISVTSSTDSGRPLAGKSAQNRTPSARTGAPPPSPTSGSTLALDTARGRRPPPREETRRHDGGVTTTSEFAYGPPPAGGFYAYRSVVVPADLDILQGPLEGIVKLPAHIDTSARARYDL